MPALLGMGALALLLIGGIVYFVVRKNKEKS
ncbi:LPXTG cell wall anchor domain-containing protein [uncultured Dubosiella sp.]|nr:LPXTG cell wall anchor domain-containing protein [uncultured Dubosiella sp.]